MLKKTLVLLLLGIIKLKKFIELDYMEYSSDALAQAAYVTNAYTTDQIPTMTSNTTPSGVASAYSTPIYAAWIAMNDTNTSETDCWHSDATLNTVGYTWLQYQFTSAKIIERYTITGRNYEGPPGASPYPTTWKLQGSNNGTDWVDLDTQTGQTFTQSEKKTYSFQNTTAYVYYRLWITESSNGVHASIGEWELLEAYTQCYSEATIKTQGSYALKAVAAAVDTFSSQYPTQDTDHVKATIEWSTTSGSAWYATDSAKPLTGPWDTGGWFITGIENQRFHIDLGSAKIINSIYYENYHDAGTQTDRGTKNFTLWGSNTADSFAELTYGIDTGWNQIGGALQMDIHITADSIDPKYIRFNNSVAYRYYALKIVDNWGNGTYLGLRRIELQIGTGGSLNKTLTHTFSSTSDLSGVSTLKFDMRASRTGSNVKIGFHDSGGTTTEITPNILSADTFQTVTVDISAVSDADKDAIDSIIFTMVNADEANTVYIDNMRYH